MAWIPLHAAAMASFVSLTGSLVTVGPLVLSIYTTKSIRESGDLKLHGAEDSWLTSSINKSESEARRRTIPLTPSGLM